MYQLLKVDAHTLKVEEHIQRLADGTYQLPEFQRTFVWDEERILRLWDSLYQGFPIGQIMLWQPTATDFPMRAFGRRQADSRPAPSTVAVIDGQQRLTALWVVLSGETNLRFDLARNRFVLGGSGENVLRLDCLRSASGERASFESATENDYFRVHATDAQRRDFSTAINRLNGILRNRALPSQVILNADYGTVLSIFRRLNQQGEPLNEAQLTLAGISSVWPGVFRRTYNLLRRLNDEMGFDQTEDPTFVFQVWTAVHTGQHLVKHLAPEDQRSRYWRLRDAAMYERSWADTEQGIEQLITVMRRDLDLTNFQFLKGYYPLAVAAHFYARHPRMSDAERSAILRWLLLSITSGRYHSQGQSKYGADIKSSIRSLEALFGHRTALDPRRSASVHLAIEPMLEASFRSPYLTLLYLLARRQQARDWHRLDLPVGDALPGGSAWQYHHVFPHETFDGERADLRNEVEEAEYNGDQVRAEDAARRRQELEARVSSIGNLAFLAPSTNQSISNRQPSDYLREIASTATGRAALEAQFIPLEPTLWLHTAFDAFRHRRCELMAAKATALFFTESKERFVWMDMPDPPAEEPFWKEETT